MRGKWYENVEESETFRVLSVDEDSELIEIEYLDGEIEELVRYLARTRPRVPANRKAGRMSRMKMKMTTTRMKTKKTSTTTMTMTMTMTTTMTTIGTMTMTMTTRTTKAKIVTEAITSA
ncbi:MAG: DUF6763 family protein [Steroidobacteraceae bacterium]